MRMVAVALLLSVSTAIGGCDSMDALGLGDLHLGDAGSPQPAQSDILAPQSEGALYLGAVEGLEKQQRFGAALAFLDQYAAKEKELPTRYWLLRGNALLGSARYADAAASFASLDATTLAPQGWNGKGRAAAASDQWAAAMDGFRKAVTGNPSNADFLNNLAFAQLHLGLAAEAERNLRQARELAPQSDLVRNNLAIALMLRGDHAGADEVLRSVTSASERQRIVALALKFAQTPTSTEKS